MAARGSVKLHILLHISLTRVCMDVDSMHKDSEDSISDVDTNELQSLSALSSAELSGTTVVTPAPRP